MASPSGTTNSNKMIEGTTNNNNNNEIIEEELMPVAQMASSRTTSNNNEITQEGNTSNDNEIPEEETGQLNTHERERPLIPPPPLPPLPRTTLMASSGTTSNNNEITVEGTTSNNNDIKEGMNSTSNNNGISEDHVPVFVAYNGKWEYDGKEWFFKNFKFSMIVVPKHITLSELIDILRQQFEVIKEFYRLKLEVHYRTGCPWFPVTEIKNDQDLSVFISETSKTKLPLCVTLLDDDEIRSNDDEISCDDDEIRSNDDEISCDDDEIRSNDDEISCDDDEIRSNDDEISCDDDEIRSNDDEISSDDDEERRKDHVRVLVAYNGKWRWDEEKWLFENSKGSIMDVSKYVTLWEITNMLYYKFEVDRYSNDLKLEVHYRGGSPWFPIIEIKDDHDLSVFISESWKTKLPLCVTRVAKVVVVEGAEHGGKDNKVEKRLINAIKEGDWVKAREIINTEEVTWTSKLNDDGYTALHYAVGRYRDNEVAREILMGINSKELLTIVDKERSTLAHHAALFGNTEALKLMLDSKPECLFNYDDNGCLVIHYALATPGIKTFLYLFEKMKSYKVKYDSFFGGIRGLNLLHQVIDTGLIDVAYELINDYPSLATTVYRDRTAIDCIIRKPELFYSGTSYGFYLRFVYHNVPTEDYSFGSTDTADVENQETPKKDKFVTKYTWRCLHDVISRICVKLWETALLKVPHIKHVKDDKVKHNTTIKLLRRICEEANRIHTSSDIERLYSSPFCLAVENNTAEAIDVLTTYFPKLYDYKKDGQNIYQLNVLNRSEKVYSYILHHGFYAKVVFSTYKDSDGNNILHLAGRLAPVHKLNVASGAALQMQRELQWFEEVQKVVPLAHTQALNNDKETPMMVFREAHKALRKDGEEWMKKTAESYTITAALIITIVFAAAITVPGGNDSATGKPIYETKASLILFAISDAISLFTSTTSLLFLSILTARYADEDFLYTLPKRLIFGLVMLFVSVTSMMIAFSAALYIMFGQGKAWILIPIVALACLPIASFVKLQFPLLVELISSTYVHGIFGNEKGYWQSSVDGNKKKRV